MTSTDYLIKEAFKLPGMGNITMPSFAKPLLAAAVGSLPLLSLASRPELRDFTEAKQHSAEELSRAARVGDILLTKNDKDRSLFANLSDTIQGVPYTHAEIVGKKNGMKGTGFVTQYVPRLHEALNSRGQTILLRHKKLKNISDEKQKNISNDIQNITGESYGPTKLVASLARTTLPDALTKSLRIGKIDDSHICSTSVAQVLRKNLGNTGLDAPEGVEIPGDFLRSKKYEAIGYTGDKPDFDRFRKRELGLRLGAGIGLGLGTHKLLTGFKNAGPNSLLKTLAGGLAGGAVGGLVDYVGYTGLPKALERVFGKERFDRINDQFHKTVRTYQGFPALAGAGLGALGAYHLNKV